MLGKDNKKQTNSLKLSILTVLFCLIIYFSIDLVFVMKVKNFDSSVYLTYKILDSNELTRKVFKGKPDNNYIKYNNLMWRILRVNSNGTITLILDDIINILPWETSDFNINNYLNTYFKNNIDTSLLINNNICEDEIKDTNHIDCNYITSSLVSLLDVHSFAESFENGETFINGDLWLINSYDSDNKWSTDNYKLSKRKNNKYLNIKPVVTLIDDIKYEKGDGSKDNPYLISSNLSIGSTVKIKNDYYTVYNIDDYIWLKSNNLIMDYKYTGKINDAFIYLKENVYSKMDYKDIIEEVNWEVNDLYTLNTSTVVNSKIGVMNNKDLKINVEYNTYIASTHGNYILINNDAQLYGTKNKTHKIIPCIAISKSFINKMVYSDNVYEVVGT